MRKEFEVHRLNAEGMAKASRLAGGFSHLLSEIEKECNAGPDHRGEGGRELALVRTHLELASFYAKKAMAAQKANQEAAS